MAKVVLFNKPYGVHSQFRKDDDSMQTLADFFDDRSLRVAGRLDKDSEGLLVLTDHGGLNHLITTPPQGGAYQGFTKQKWYLVQVENLPCEDQLNVLRQGVLLNDGKTRPAKVGLIADDALPIVLWERNPPIRERKTVPTAWLLIGIVEGKNRQVRRMVASVGLPCLRLIRYQVGEWTLDGLAVGQSRTIYLSQAELTAFGVDEMDKAEQMGKFAKPKRQFDARQADFKQLSKKPKTTPKSPKRTSAVVKYRPKSAKSK